MPKSKPETKFILGPYTKKTPYTNEKKISACVTAILSGSISTAAKKHEVGVSSIYTWLKAFHLWDSYRRKMDGKKYYYNASQIKESEYTDNFRLLAVKHVLEGGSVTKTSNELGVSTGSLYTWLRAYDSITPHLNR